MYFKKHIAQALLFFLLIVVFSLAKATEIIDTPLSKCVNKNQLRQTDYEQVRTQISSQKYGKTIINLLGIPGSGKGTQAEHLKLHTGLPHISIGDLFRDEKRNKTLLNDLIDVSDATYPNFSDLYLPDEIWFGILLKRLSQPDCAKGYILDHFPRTAIQANIFLQAILRPEDRHIPIYMDLSEDIMEKRLKGRYICPKCGMQVRNHEGDHGDVCKNPSCNGQKLHYREEDRNKVKMHERFIIFKENIGPLIDVLKKRDEMNHIKLNGHENPIEVSGFIDKIVFEKILPRTISTDVEKSNSPDPKISSPITFSPNLSIKFFMMRHGESMATLNSALFSERVPSEIPLTKEGHVQAKMAAEKLKKYYENNPGRKLKIIHNQARRIIETKDEILTTLGKYISTVIYDKRTEELNHGEFNSLTSKQMSEIYPDVYEKFYYSGEDEGKLIESFKVPLPNGESKEDLLHKTKELLLDIVQQSSKN